LKEFAVVLAHADTTTASSGTQSSTRVRLNETGITAAESTVFLITRPYDDSCP